MKPEAVIERLLQTPHRFGFFQAVRLLERWFAQQQGLSRGQMLANKVAFRNSISLAFPASEIESMRAIWADPAQADTEVTEVSAPANPATTNTLERLEMTPAFMGLLGASGALPSHYTELVAARETLHRDGATRAFMDIFLHRAVALFYEAWRKHRLAIQFEADRRSRYLPLMLSVAGLGQTGLRDRLRAHDGGVADDALAHFAGSLQRRPVSARVIQQLLTYYFRVPVKLDQFIGRWFQLPQGNQSHLGLANMALGKTAVVGERVWQRDLRLRLTFGPLNGERFKRFLPGGTAATALKELLQLLSGPTLEYEVRLALKAEDLRGAALDEERGVRLGWDSFLVTHTQTGLRTDAGYELLTLA